MKEEQKDFIDSYEENDIIGSLLNELLKEKGVKEDLIKTAYIEYHAVSDGKHKVFIDEEKAFNIDAWNTESDLKESVEEWLKSQNKEAC